MILYINDKGIINKRAVKLFFDQLKAGKYELKADRLNKRSGQQNRYLWGVVYPLVKDGLRNLGYDEIKTTEDAHMVCKARFLKINKPDKDGQVIEVFRSTTTLSKTEMMEYISSIQQFAAEHLDTYIPDPNEQTEIW